MSSCPAADSHMCSLLCFTLTHCMWQLAINLGVVGGRLSKSVEGAHFFCEIRAGARIFRGVKVFCYTGFYIVSKQLLTFPFCLNWEYMLQRSRTFFVCLFGKRVLYSGSHGPSYINNNSNPLFLTISLSCVSNTSCLSENEKSSAYFDR